MTYYAYALFAVSGLVLALLVFRILSDTRRANSEICLNSLKLHGPMGIDYPADPKELKPMQMFPGQVCTVRGFYKDSSGNLNEKLVSWNYHLNRWERAANYDNRFVNVVDEPYLWMYSEAELPIRSEMSRNYRKGIAS